MKKVYSITALAHLMKLKGERDDLVKSIALWVAISVGIMVYTVSMYLYGQWCMP